MISKKNVTITGEWDGQPIYREMTPEERVVRDLKHIDPSLKKKTDEELLSTINLLRHQ